MIKYLVKGQNIETLEHEIIAADQIAFVKIHFVFDNSWKPLHKVVQFSQDEFTYNRVLGFDDTSCLLPAELIAGAVKMSLFGYDASASETVRATTVVKTLHIRPSGFDGDGVEPIPPTPDLYAQLLQELEEKADGLQAGTDGKDGKDGQNGASAYEIAVQHGFSGTEAEWLASIKGEKGDTGEQGLQGEKGDTGAAGVNGRDGTDGFSPAASVEQTETGAVISITDKTGTTTATIKNGSKGEKGDTGAQGLQGEKGDKGDTGEQGLKGEKGEKGNDGADGFSPIAVVSKSGSVVTITITDKNGTTTASITEGASVDLSSYVTDSAFQQYKDQTELKFQQVDETYLSISDRTTLLENKAHAHENQDVLDEVTSALWQKVSLNSHTHNNLLLLSEITPADIQNLHSGAFYALEQLEKQVGDIQTALASIVEVTE